MSLQAWQTALRREFGRAQRFLLQNTGAEPVFSEFAVTNPQTNGVYRVAIRGRNPGDNYCSCPRLRRQHPWHLQAHRVHAGEVGKAAGWPGCACCRIPSRLLRSVSPLRCETRGRQVLLGGTRLKRFMESVEKATGTIPAPMPQETAESQAEASMGLQDASAEDETGGNGRKARTAKPEGPTAGLADVLTAGLSFLDTLGKALGAGEATAQGGKGHDVSVDSFVGRDPTTGQAYLKLPMPGGETLKKITDALGALAQAFQPGS